MPDVRAAVESLLGYRIVSLAGGYQFQRIAWRTNAKTEEREQYVLSVRPANKVEYQLFEQLCDPRTLLDLAAAMED